MRTIAPAVHPGRLLKRELSTRGLSANRLALDIGVLSGRISRYLERPPRDQRRYRRAASAAISATGRNSGSICKASMISR